MLFSKHCLLFFIVIFICFCFTSAAHKKKLGIKVTNAIECPNPENQMDTNNPVSARAFLRITGKDSSLVDINYNISRPFGPLFLSLRVFQVVDDKMKLIFKSEYLSCKNPLTFQVIRTVKGLISKDCIAEKGIFWVRDINIDKFSWILTKAASSPGQYIYELEYKYAKGCVYCIRTVCEFFIKK